MSEVPLYIVYPKPHTLHPTPYTLHPTSYSINTDKDTAGRESSRFDDSSSSRLSVRQYAALRAFFITFKPRVE